MEQSPPVDVADRAADLGSARGGDEEAFARLVGPLRGELHLHCYRMLGSVHDADDAVQDSLIKAWRALDTVSEPRALRSWLYTIATRTCLDQLRGSSRRALPVDLGPSAEAGAPLGPAADHVAWLGPCPSGDLADSPAAPGARYEQREAVELAFVAAVQHLPGNQRAALLLGEVLGLSAVEIAEALGTTTGSVTSAQQRARATVRARVPGPTQQQTLRRLGERRVRDLVTGYADALQRGDADGLVALLTEDVTWSMPPLPQWYAGLDGVLGFARAFPLGRCGSWRHTPVSANGQPALASYLRPPGSPSYDAWGIDVLGLREGRICSVTSFLGAHHHAAFGLPSACP